MFKAKLLNFLFFVSSVSQLASQTVGGITTGAAAYCDSINSGFISLINYQGSILYWESSDNGFVWKNIGNNHSTQSYTNLKKSQSYRAIVKNGNFSNDTSSVTTISVHLARSIGAINGGATFCNNSGAGKLQLVVEAENILYWQKSEDNMVWSNISNTTSILSYSNHNQTTYYRIIAHPLLKCPIDTSKVSIIKIDPSTSAGYILGADSMCLGTKGNNLTIKNYTGTIIDWLQSVDQGVLWQSLAFNGTSLTYTNVTRSIWYKTIVKSGTCNTATTSVAIIAPYPSNYANAGEDKIITQYETIKLNGSGNGSPSWNNETTLSNMSIFEPMASPINTTIYRLTLNDSHHCVTEDEVKITVMVPIPTAITPNSDGVNDYLILDKMYINPKNILKIFNRWGIQVYSASPYLNDWDGKTSNGQQLPDEIYYYVLDLGNGEKAITNFILIQR